VRAVAERLSVSTATVYKLCEQRRLRFIRVSGAIRIDPSSVEEFIASAA
jgi:excisionase family DNA binding protein